ncbi:hypothetical protein HDU97_001892 [Phlyctochytrium planicorne]|nr:hypothetical protein HDU97_001892 [Phlyctochytrium planicorne]
MPVVNLLDLSRAPSSPYCHSARVATVSSPSTEQSPTRKTPIPFPPPLGHPLQKYGQYIESLNIDLCQVSFPKSYPAYPPEAFSQLTNLKFITLSITFEYSNTPIIPYIRFFFHHLHQVKDIYVRFDCNHVRALTEEFMDEELKPFLRQLKDELDSLNRPDSIQTDPTHCEVIREDFHENVVRESFAETMEALSGMTSLFGLNITLYGQRPTNHQVVKESESIGDTFVDFDQGTIGSDMNDPSKNLCLHQRRSITIGIIKYG